MQYNLLFLTYRLYKKIISSTKMAMVYTSQIKYCTNDTLKRVAIEDFDDFVFSSVAGGNNPDTKEHLEALSNS